LGRLNYGPCIYISATIQNIAGVSHPVISGANFFFVYAQLVLDKGLTLNNSMEIILSSTAHTDFSYHSSIIHLYPKHTTVFLPAGLPAINHCSIHAIKYVFAHDEFCPWGA